MKQIEIKSQQSKRYCKSLIDELPEDGSHTVSIKKTDMSPTAKQRRLQWLWNGEVAAAGIGSDDTKEAVHTRAKWMFARPILLRDDDVFQIIYEAFMNTVKDYYDALKATCCRDFTEHYISTERLSRKQRAEYLTEFKSYWWGKGVSLTDPALQGVDLEKYRGDK